MCRLRKPRSVTIHHRMSTCRTNLHFRSSFVFSQFNCECKRRLKTNFARHINRRFAARSLVNSVVCLSSFSAAPLHRSTIRTRSFRACFAPAHKSLRSQPLDMFNCESRRICQDKRERQDAKHQTHMPTSVILLSSRPNSVPPFRKRSR